jgi:hypothetical protein
MIGAIIFWWFVVYLGFDWESPSARLVSIYGPYPSREDCAAVQREHMIVSGSLQKSPCFDQIVRLVK